jgi:ubiquinone/menaquinone biosynthesis C-methylase UbiE
VAAPTAHEDIRDVNVRYHDVAAREYDAKWGIDFGDIGRDQVLGKLRKVLGRDVGPFASSLEIGAGTGYFTLNLLRAGVVREATCTDISPGMLETLETNARRIGVPVVTQVADAERLPFEDEQFDLVFGHAVLHHIPDLGRAFGEFMRVLRPGGTLFFAGEPSRQGDRIAAVPKKAALRAAPLWRRALGAGPAPEHHDNGNGQPDDHHLEYQVDVHAFDPGQLTRFAEGAGFTDAKVRGEELLANWFGWTSRTLEASADPLQVPWGWKLFAYRGYITLQKVDRALLEPYLPPTIFYNLILSARKAG